MRSPWRLDRDDVQSRGTAAAEHQLERPAVRQRALEAALATDHVAFHAGTSLTTVARWVATHPGPSLQLFRAAMSLPTLHIALDDGPEAAVLWEQARRRATGDPDARRRTLYGRSAYPVPADGRAFSGRHAHGRRSAVNRAVARGLTTGRIDARAADEVLPTFEDAPPRRCGGCEGPHWAARHPDGHVVALTHVHVAGQYAQLVHAVHARGEPVTDAARYALHAQVAADLASDGVRFLLLFDNYFTMTPGRREFQRILGYWPCHLRLDRDGAPSKQVVPPPEWSQRSAVGVRGEGCVDEPGEEHGRTPTRPGAAAARCADIGAAPAATA